MQNLAQVFKLSPVALVPLLAERSRGAFGSVGSEKHPAFTQSDRGWRTEELVIAVRHVRAKTRARDW